MPFSPALTPEVPLLLPVLEAEAGAREGSLAKEVVAKEPYVQAYIDFFLGISQASTDSSFIRSIFSVICFFLRSFAGISFISASHPI